MSSNTHLHLKKLREVTNEILKEAYENREKIPGAINWADLSCTETRYIQNDGGDEYFEVLIEEADPTSHNLIQFVICALRERGFHHLTYPVCEW